MEQQKRKELTRDRIVSAGLSVARAEGGDVLSMRRVATEAKSGVSAIYRYFESKDALLEAMLDEIALNLEHPEASDDPTEEIVSIFSTLKETMVDEPWLVPVLMSGYQASVHILPFFERITIGLHRLGWDESDSLEVIEWVLHFTYGAVLSQAAQENSIASDRGHLLIEHMSKYPSFANLMHMSKKKSGSYENFVRRVVKRTT